MIFRLLGGIFKLVGYVVTTLVEYLLLMLIEIVRYIKKWF